VGVLRKEKGMRAIGAIFSSLLMLAYSTGAEAVTLTNLDKSSAQIFVCDSNCGPSHGEDWGSAFDFWLAANETKTFPCADECFVGIYYDGHSPSLGDMADADDDEVFRGDERGFIQSGYAVHTPK
jgi:hypothetical protein